jgi:hypothetical protein
MASRPPAKSQLTSDQADHNLSIGFTDSEFGPIVNNFHLSPHPVKTSNLRAQRILQALIRAGYGDTGYFLKIYISRQLSIIG